jgi:hypothetical protein
MPPKPLESSELAMLLVRLEEAVGETAGRFRFQMGLVAGFFFLMALVYGAAMNEWGVAAFIAAFGVGMVVLGVVASRRTSPERMRPIVDAIRDAPERITLVRYYDSSDSGRMFVTHWIEIKTADHRLIIKAQEDFHQLYGYLERRCPNAEFKGRR